MDIRFTQSSVSFGGKNLARRRCPTNRIDNFYGDRNLSNVYLCAPSAAYADDT
jgi:hypothetical protein